MIVFFVFFSYLFLIKFAYISIFFKNYILSQVNKVNKEYFKMYQ